MIKLSQVSKIIQGKALVNNVSLEVAKGELVVVLGPSGSGKTLLLKLINRLRELSSGQITLENKDITTLDLITLRRSMGYVFQEVGLFPHLNVEDNLTLVPHLRQIPKQQRLTLAHEILNQVNLPPDIYAKRYPKELSGGQKQRVGVARALLVRPKCLLMDEPFGALDAINRDILQTELLRLKQLFNQTILFVTHDIFEAIRLADRIAILNNGSLEQMGTKKEILQSPATSYVEELFAKAAFQLDGYMSLLKESQNHGK